MLTGKEVEYLKSNHFHCPGNHNDEVEGIPHKTGVGRLKCSMMHVEEFRVSMYEKNSHLEC